MILQIFAKIACWRVSISAHDIRIQLDVARDLNPFQLSGIFLPEIWATNSMYLLEREEKAEDNSRKCVSQPWATFECSSFSVIQWNSRSWSSVFESDAAQHKTLETRSTSIALRSVSTRFVCFLRFVCGLRTQKMKCNPITIALLQQGRLRKLSVSPGRNFHHING